MNADTLLDDVLVREGGFRAEVQRPNGTIDFSTMYGITAKTAQAWFQLATLPSANWMRQNVTPAIAKQIYQQRYIDDPGFTPATIPFEPLRVQLIDFGINSGPARAIRWLQRVVGMPESHVDGVLGPYTTTVLLARVHGDPWVWRLINDALVAARSYMIDQAVDTGAIRRADEEGLESRALSFFLSRP